MEKVIVYIPTVHLLLPEQGDHSLEDHTRDFLDLVCLTHYPYCLLCVFYHTELIEQSKTHGWPLRGSFIEYEERVLVQCDSSFTICLTDKDITSLTADPEPSQPSVMPATEQEQEPELTAIARGCFHPGAGPNTESVQLCESILVEFVSMRWSSTHTCVAEVSTMSWVP